jgi:hypothetical protein
MPRKREPSRSAGANKKATPATRSCDSSAGCHSEGAKRPRNPSGKKATPATRSCDASAGCHSEGAPRPRNPSEEIASSVPTRKAGGATLVDSPEASPAASPGASSRANAREFADAVFAKVDPVNVARELLEGGDAKGGSVRARVWETLLEYRYGRPPAADSADAGAPLCVRIISHIPRPQRDDDTVEAT